MSHNYNQLSEPLSLLMQPCGSTNSMPSTSTQLNVSIPNSNTLLKIELPESEESVDELPFSKQAKHKLFRRCCCCCCCHYRNFLNILKDLMHQLPRDAGEAESQGQSLRIQLKSVPHYRIVQKYLSEKHIPFHTFSLSEEREVKIVIEGIPYSSKPETIKEELAILGYFLTSISPLSTACKQTMNSFLVKLRKTLLISSITFKCLCTYGYMFRLSICDQAPRSVSAASNLDTPAFSAPILYAQC